MGGTVIILARTPDGVYLDGQIYRPGEALPIDHVLAGIGVTIVGQEGAPLNVLSAPAQGALFANQAATAGAQAPATYLVEGTVVTETNSGAIRGTLVARLPAALGPGGGVKTDETLGSGLGVLRGNATAASAALPSGSYSFGFVLKNASATLTMWVKQGTVTTADGYPLGPGERLHLSLPDPSILHVITSAGSAPWAIAAVTP